MVVFDASDASWIQFPIGWLPPWFSPGPLAIVSSSLLLRRSALCVFEARLPVLILYYLEARVERLIRLHESALVGLLVFFEPVQDFAMKLVPEIVEDDVVPRSIFLGRPRSELIVSELAVSELQEEVLVGLHEGLFERHLVDWNLELHLEGRPLLFPGFDHVEQA